MPLFCTVLLYQTKDINYFQGLIETREICLTELIATALFFFVVKRSLLGKMTSGDSLITTYVYTLKSIKIRNIQVTHCKQLHV